MKEDNRYMVGWFQEWATPHIGGRDCYSADCFKSLKEAKAFIEYNKLEQHDAFIITEAEFLGED